MKFEEVEIPTYQSDYDDVFEALLSAHSKGKALRITTDTHPQSIRAALKRRLSDNQKTRGLFLTVSVNDDGCTIFIEKERCIVEPSA